MKCHEEQIGLKTTVRFQNHKSKIAEEVVKDYVQRNLCALSLKTENGERNRRKSMTFESGEKITPKQWKAERGRN